MNNKAKTVYQAIYDEIDKIPKGKVATYKQIAENAGLAGHARMVGYALYRTPADLKIPWHRVINSQGKISYAISRNGHDDLQKHLLQEEGILFSKTGVIDLDKYGI